MGGYSKGGEVKASEGISAGIVRSSSLHHIVVSTVSVSIAIATGTTVSVARGRGTFQTGNGNCPKNFKRNADTES